MGIVEPEISNRNILIDKIKPKYIDPIVDEFGNDEDPTFQIAVINTEDNADYIPPKGVKGEYDQLNEIRSKEQSLVLQFNNLPPKHTGVAQKTLYTLNQDQKKFYVL